MWNGAYVILTRHNGSVESLPMKDFRTAQEKARDLNKVGAGTAIALEVSP